MSAMNILRATPAGRPPELPAILTVARETALSRLVRAYILTGLFFMLVPGTFLGAWNLLALSQPAGTKLSAAWVQAHGHAQIFGWIGTFILGIGFYSIPRVTRAGKFALSRGWTCWVLWTLGVLLRWSAGVTDAYWPLTLSFGAVLELSAFVIFLATISGHRPEGKSKRLDSWIFVVMAGTFGFFALLLTHTGLALALAVNGASAATPPGTNAWLLTLATYGFLVPFVWGFSARWLPVFLGLQPTRERWMLTAVAINAAGVLLHALSMTLLAMLTLSAAAAVMTASLRIAEPSLHPPKITGVHPSFPWFVRSAYAWLLIATALAVCAVLFDRHHGWWGASRHAVTVGFISTMVLAVGQRVLPAFGGMKVLFSPRLMFLSLGLLAIGCALRVIFQVLAYEGIAAFAWKALPWSAGLEMVAVLLFAVNLAATFVRPAPHRARLQPV